MVRNALKTSISRRKMICLCGSSGLALALPGCGGGGDNGQTESAQGLNRGCLLTAATGVESNTAGCGAPTPTSGNPGEDAALISEFNAQQGFWGIPGISFSFLNDCNSPNAYAQPDTKAILFGTTLASQTYLQFGTLVPLWQIIAHEFGHQVQFYFGDSWLNAPTVSPKELEADMFSGFYLILAKSTSVTYQEMSTSISNAFALGDWQYNNPNHHGTPAQRGAAVLAGGKIANEWFGNQIPRTYSALRQRFAQELALILGG